MKKLTKAAVERKLARTEAAYDGLLHAYADAMDENDRLKDTIAILVSEAQQPGNN